ncbi:MAG: DNA primase [Rickettsiales bacterium]|nr:DNA primase [Rickettsiales bacterium]
MATDFKSFREDLLSRASIVDIVSKKVPLKPKGKDFWGCCPFHNEKTPSFSVNEDKGFYHCFGCGAHGGALDFIMKTDNLPFMEAVEYLAGILGVQVPSFKPVDPAQQQRALGYLDIMSGAAELYSKALFDSAGAEALKYLRGRGITDDIIRQYQIGFAPRGNSVSNKFAAKAKDALYATQLVRKSSAGAGDYDFFRDRIMFPILDPKGRVIAFSGRAMGSEEPKYINIAETEFFHKKRTLYGLYYAKKGILESKRAIVVEGQVDAIQMQGAGFLETVAPLGSALSSDHVQILLKLTRNIIFCFDGDTAGKKAAARAVDVVMPFMRSDMSVKILTLPGGLDPDDILKKQGAEKMSELVGGAVPIVDYLWDLANAGFNVQTPAGRANAEKFLKARTGVIPDEVLRRHIEQAFRNMEWENWARKTTGAKAGPMPGKPKSPDEIMGEIIEAYPGLYERHFEFLSGISVKKTGKKTELSEPEAERVVRIRKASEYRKSLLADLARATGDAAEALRAELEKTEKFLEEI